jgi:uncharacterized protein
MDLITKQFKIDTNTITDKGEFTGVASHYGSKDYANDIVVKGAFTQSIRENNNKVVLLLHHKIDEPVGLVEIEDSNEALMVRGKINLDVTKGREAFALMKQGAITGLSVGFLKEKWDFDPVKQARIIQKGNLKEISLVTFPCNEKTKIDLMSVKSEDLASKEDTKDIVPEIKNSMTADEVENLITALMKQREEELQEKAIKEKFDKLNNSIKEFLNSYNKGETDK